MICVIYWLKKVLPSRSIFALHKLEAHHGIDLGPTYIQNCSVHRTAHELHHRGPVYIRYLCKINIFYNFNENFEWASEGELKVV